MTEPAHDEPSHPAQAARAAIRVLALARAWAYFAVGADGTRLLASDKIDCGCLDQVALLAGVQAGPEPPARSPQPADDTTRCRLMLAFPRTASAHNHGLLYLEDPPAHPSLGLLLELHAHELDALLRVPVDTHAPVPARVTADHATTRAAEADALRALLEQHEGSIARVARLLGVTRMTVYNRMQRYGVQRIRVRRSPRPEPPRREDP